jgi:hypothetical protein
MNAGTYFIPRDWQCCQWQTFNLKHVDDFHTSFAMRRLAHAFSRDSVKGVQNTDSEPVTGTVQDTPTLDPTTLTRNPLATTSSTTASLKSSSVPPGNPVSQPNDSDVPENILAFRLITKLLRKIPHTQPFLSVDNLRDINNWDTGDRREVRISDAFAHLVVTEHENVAIATNRYPPNLDIMACPNNLAPTTSSSGSTDPPPDDSFFGNISKLNIWRILMSKNARYGDPTRSFPAIISPEEPSGYSKFADLNAYMNNLEKNW